jgi:hypothetical protein
MVLLARIKRLVIGRFIRTPIHTFSITELAKKRTKLNEDIFIAFINSMSIAFFSGLIYYYGYQHLSIMFLIFIIAWLLVVIDNKQMIQQIDIVLKEKVRRQLNGE